MTKNRFLVFAGEEYYSAGGAYNLYGAYPTLEEAEKAVDSLPQYIIDEEGIPGPVYLEWHHIFDVEKLEVVNPRSWDSGHGSKIWPRKSI